MIVTRHRVRPFYGDSQKGIVSTQPIKEGLPVWAVGGPNDRAWTFDTIKTLHPQSFEVLLNLGVIRLAFSQQWVVCPELKLVNWSTHSREANLRLEPGDVLVAFRNIKNQEELVFPSELDADLNWKRRMLGGWKRKGDSVSAKANLQTYLKYLKRIGVGR